MACAYILVEVSVGTTPEGIAAIKQMQVEDCTIEKAVAITGPYDILVILEAKDFDAIGDFIARMKDLSVVDKTTTFLEIHYR